MRRNALAAINHYASEWRGHGEIIHDVARKCFECVLPVVLSSNNSTQLAEKRGKNGGARLVGPRSR